jgi:excisionase family DNA binding protein
MQTKNLSIKALAVIIGVSPDTIRRSARRGEIPSTRVGTAYRFDLPQVRHQMERNAVASRQEGIDGRAGRREPAARRVKRPRTGNTGAWLTS